MTDTPEEQEPKVHDKRRIDPDTGDVRREPAGKKPRRSPIDSDEPAVDEAPEGVEDVPLVEAEGPDASTGSGPRTDLSDEDLALLAEAERDLVAEYRERAARAEAELVNFRARVERDRAANREAVVADVIRSLLPAIDDLDRAEAHGDLVEGAPLTLVAQKLRASFDRYGLKRVGEPGDVFDPKYHEALFRVPTEGASEETIAEVIEVGYLLGERLIRAAKVAVAVPE